MKLNFFSDRSFLPKETGHVQMLFPFWGKNYEEHEPLRAGCGTQQMKWNRKEQFNFMKR